MKIISVNKNITDGKAILSADIESENYPDAREIFFAYPQEFADHLPVSADPFFPAVLIPAMLAGEDLEVAPPLSGKIFASHSLIQDILSTWYPEKMNRVSVHAENLTQTVTAEPVKNATFFSLGVDSMYSMLKHLPANDPPPGRQLNSLIFMKGLELPLSVYANGQDRELIATIKKLGDHYNLELLTGETNIRDVFPVSYEKYYFGPCLAATALSLSAGFKNIFIPSSNSYADLLPDPGSPLLDPLWSNETTKIIHDGSEKERAEKIADLISLDNHALNNLRVCVNNEGGSSNCCRCWKCTRTMVTLDIIDRLKDSKAFPLGLPGNYARELRTYDPDSMVYTKENLKLARKYGKKEIAEKLYNEIRIGTFDIYREGKPMRHMLMELVCYFSVKLGRAVKILDF
ncbi:MAG: hypothetical protein R6U58_13515 [Bacteroidales bacterium]